MTKICSLPWTHLATHPHGGCTLCCIADHAHGASRAKNYNGQGVKPTWLTLNQHSVDDIMNSDYYKEVRLQMLAGQEPKSCTRCYDDERAGLHSKRQQENERYLDSIQDQIASTEADGTIPVSFRFIELRLGNVCNLQCRTCNPASSSKWAKDYAHMEGKFDWVAKFGKVERGQWFESDEFWQQLLERSHELERIYINGGEPTLVEKHFVYLEKLIKAGINHNVELWYNINLSQIPGKLIDLWSKFKQVKVSASIDDLGARNDYIRYGSNWDTTMKNLMLLKGLSWIDLGVMQTISAYSVPTLAEFYQFFGDKGIQVHLNWCYDPAYLSPWILPHDVKQRAIEACKPVMPSWDYKNVEEHLNKIAEPYALEKFKLYTHELDQLRNEKFEDVFPELARVI
jgi:sulfatase maturation enzyme AslB (radical SAM superfamily)